MRMRRGTTTTTTRSRMLYEADADDTTTTTGSSAGSSGGGGGSGTIASGSYKAIGQSGKEAQYILNRLFVTILATLANFWNWLASRLNICASTPDQSATATRTTFCANGAEGEDFGSSTITKSAEVIPNRNSSSAEINQVHTSQETNIKMTIEVSSDTMAKVTPSQQFEQEDQGIVMMNKNCSLPVLRLNSESFEEMQAFSEEEESSSDNNGQSHNSHHRHSEDSCSDYCSGSGSPVPGSPSDLLREDEDTFAPSKDFIIPTSYEGELETELSQTGSVVQSILVLRRDSDTSDSSVNEEGQQGDDVPVPAEVASKILTQVEAMFSDEHLAKDGFLLKHVRRRSDGFVSLKLVAGLRKVKQISREFPVVLTSLKQSEVLEVNSEGTKIRRKEALTPVLKSLPIKQAKKEKSQSEKENAGGGGNNSSADENVIRSVNNKENMKFPTTTTTTMRNANQNQRNVPAPGNAAPNSRRNSNTTYTNVTTGKGPVSRKSSNVSTGSSTNSSRNNSFSTASGRPHPADLFRHMMNSGEDASQVVRRGRGGSLPISAIQSQHRGSICGSQLSPNSSPPDAATGFLRPKSNSYCEGTTVTLTGTTNGMSPWLLRRKASVASSRLSSGDVVISGVIRQPRGPDGTKGFHSGYRALILEERIQASQTSICST